MLVNNENLLNDIQFIWNVYDIENDLYQYQKPKQNLSITYSYRYHPCNCGLNVNWKWKSNYEYQQINLANELISYKQEGYQLLDFNLFKEFPSINGGIHFGVKNLFDITSINSSIQEGVHDGNLNTISWGRTFFMKLAWRPFLDF